MMDNNKFLEEYLFFPREISEKMDERDFKDVFLGDAFEAFDQYMDILYEKQYGHEWARYAAEDHEKYQNQIDHYIMSCFFELAQQLIALRNEEIKKSC